MEKKINELINQYHDEFVKWREQLHQIPELSWKEKKTSEFIKMKLDNWGVSYQSVGTSVYGDLIFTKGGKYIGYRADIDGLPIEDLKRVPYKSKNKGASHSCGHDFHTATLLATIKILSETKEKLKGKFRFIFQAAEEVLPGGSNEIIKAGVVKPLDCLLAMHAETSIPIGEISISHDWVTTEIVNFYIKIHGKGGHSARPYESVDPIFVSAQIISSIYARIDRYKKYNDFFVFSFTKINSGDRLNVIPDRCELGASLRITNSENKREIISFINTSITEVAESFKANTEIILEYGNPPVVNNKKLATEIQTILEKKKIFKKIHNDVRTMGSEDFSNYQNHVDTCYIRFGIANKNLDHGLHTSHFDIDKESVPLACNMFSNIISSLLK